MTVGVSGRNQTVGCKLAPLGYTLESAPRISNLNRRMSKDIQYIYIDLGSVAKPGRRTRFRILRETVWVQFPPLPPTLIERNDMDEVKVTETENNLTMTSGNVIIEPDVKSLLELFFTFYPFCRSINLN